MDRKIASVRGLEILDSRGTPTVRVQMTLASGITASASVPSGASTGRKRSRRAARRRCRPLWREGRAPQKIEQNILGLERRQSGNRVHAGLIETAWFALKQKCP
jgi:Enolase, N-terminal domain